MYTDYCFGICHRQKQQELCRSAHDVTTWRHKNYQSILDMEMHAVMIIDWYL